MEIGWDLPNRLYNNQLGMEETRYRTADGKVYLRAIYDGEWRVFTMHQLVSRRCHVQVGPELHTDRSVDERRMVAAIQAAFESVDTFSRRLCGNDYVWRCWERVLNVLSRGPYSKKLKTVIPSRLKKVEEGVFERAVIEALETVSSVKPMDDFSRFCENYKETPYFLSAGRGQL